MLDDIKADIKSLRQETGDRFDKLEDKMDKQYVTKAEFAPVKKIVYSSTGLILGAVIMAVLALVIDNK